MLLKPTAVLTTLIASSLAYSGPPITAAAKLAARQNDPSFVGYIPMNGGYSDARSCDYPQTVSTSGGYVQCCPRTGSCPFYTSCSANTLLAAGTSVACDVNAALTCNTALVLPTIDAANRGSYLACWQKTLGNSAFTMVQNVGSAGGTSAASTSANTASASRATTGATMSSASQTASGGISSMASSTSASAASTTASATSSRAEGVHAVSDNGGLAAAAAAAAALLLVQAL